MRAWRGARRSRLRYGCNAEVTAAGTLRTHLVEQVVVELSDEAPPEAMAQELLDISKHNGAVAIGPGSRTRRSHRRASSALFLEQNQLPIVVDASGLFHLSKHLDLLRGKPSVVTPHAGEFARLSGRGTIAPGTRVERIREFVDRTGITTLLKGSDTLIYDGTTFTSIQPAPMRSRRREPATCSPASLQRCSHRASRRSMRREPVPIGTA